MRTRLLLITAAAAILFSTLGAAPAFAANCPPANSVVQSCGPGASVGPNGGFRAGETWCNPGPVRGNSCTPARIAVKPASAPKAKVSPPVQAAAWGPGPVAPSLAGVLFGGGILFASKSIRRLRLAAL